ncbi:MAG: hypothetical protein AB8B79_02825 [Granulosicoccus sp.]
MNAGLIVKRSSGYSLSPQGRRTEAIVLTLAEFGSGYLPGLSIRGVLMQELQGLGRDSEKGRYRIR